MDEDKKPDFAVLQSPSAAPHDVLQEQQQQQQAHAERGHTSTKHMATGRAWAAGIAAGPDSSNCSEKHMAWRRFFKGMLPVLRSHPWIWITALLITLALATVSVIGVMFAAEAETQNRLLAAQGFAENTAVGFEAQLQQILAPLLALAVFVRENPYVPYVMSRFDVVAQELLSELPMSDARLVNLQVAPQGVVQLMYPLKGNEAVIGLDQLRDSVRRPAALKTVEQGKMTMQGPLMLKQGFVGLIPRLPIFISNVTDPAEQFGSPNEAYNCSLCYNATTRTRFWGFVSCIISFDAMANAPDREGVPHSALNSHSGNEQRSNMMLQSLEQRGYNYALFAPQPDGSTLLIAETLTAPRDPVSALVHTLNSNWTLLVAPVNGWVPSWRNPMLAMVIVICVIIGLMLTGLLVNRRQQAWLVRELRATNGALADEKQRMDVLLARQYNLISCLLEQGSKRGGYGDKRALARLASLQDTPDTALARIEDMRRSIGVASATTSTDQLQLLELLGEGAFGKVYRGLWRGTVVAIKTMILPARMSGAEKHERMAIMEAAISSAMNHPNIVQTYTYTIKPTSSTHAPKSVPKSKSTEVTEGSTPQSTGAPFAGDSHTLNFEVSLVLEYCELGSLRDALDAKAFGGDGCALNYAAMLETAADIARAMIHLHKQQVLHSDLKARNVLLKSDGNSGRGIVAKVADFGLAIKMDAHTTHVSEFQGTPSHMAPESQLQGRLSKAGDVYSFGITLWELYTAEHAFEGMPMALLGHQVAVRGLRPTFPKSTPEEYRDLATACWSSNAEDRPTFEDVLSALVVMRQRVGGKTQPIKWKRKAPPDDHAPQEEEEQQQQQQHAKQQPQQEEKQPQQEEKQPQQRQQGQEQEQQQRPQQPPLPPPPPLPNLPQLPHRQGRQPLQHEHQQPTAPGDDGEGDERQHSMEYKPWLGHSAVSDALTLEIHEELPSMLGDLPLAEAGRVFERGRDPGQQRGPGDV